MAGPADYSSDWSGTPPGRTPAGYSPARMAAAAPGLAVGALQVADPQGRSAAVRFHDLRHGAATMLRAAGVPIKTISAILGHSTVAFTDDIYVEVAEEMAEEAAAAIQAFVPRKGKIIPGRASNVPARGEDDH